MRVGSRCVTTETYALKHSTHCSMLATLRFLLGFSPVSFEVPPNESGRNSASSINSPFSDFLDSLSGMGMAFWPTLTVYGTSG